MASYSRNCFWYDYETQTYVITLSGGKANALAAAIPIYVTFVGSQTWSLWRTYLFVNYEKRLSQALSGPQSQRRVLIRNSSGGLPLSWDLFFWKWSWTWGRSNSTTTAHIGKRLSWPIQAFIIGLFHFLAWIFVGVFTGYLWAYPHVTNAGLATGPTCGFVFTDNTTSTLEALLYETIDNNSTIIADQYVKQCYTDAPSPTAPCGFLLQRKLDVNPTDTTCPFANLDICLSNNSTPIHLDSGYIRSNTDLGINAKDSDSILFRKNTTCSPISSVGYVDIINANATANASLWPSDGQLYRYNFGPILGKGDQSTPWTYEFNDWEPSFGSAYKLNAFPYFASSSFEAWQPNSTFWDATSDLADVALFFLNGEHTVYQYPTSDPFFQTGPSESQTINGVGYTDYVPEYYSNALACIDSYQICPSDKPSSYCTSPGGILTTTLRSQFLDLNAMQTASVQRIVTQQAFLSTYYSIQARGGAGLLASLSLVDDLQSRNLSNTQWREEVTHWFSISLAKLQLALVTYATGPSAPELLPFLQKPEADSSLAKQCHMQKVLIPAGTINFNFNAIIVLLAVGVPLWSLGRCFEYLVSWCWRWRRNQRRLQWILDAPCQLQRLGYEAAGYGTWVKGSLQDNTPTWEQKPRGIWPELNFDENELVLKSAPINRNHQTSSAPASTGVPRPAPIPKSHPLRPPASSQSQFQSTVTPSLASQTQPIATAASPASQPPTRSQSQSQSLPAAIPPLSASQPPASAQSQPQPQFTVATSPPASLPLASAQSQLQPQPAATTPSPASQPQSQPTATASLLASQPPTSTQPQTQPVAIAPPP